MRTDDAASPSHHPADTAPGLIIRAREPGDAPEIAALLQLPRVRWGTLQLPYVSAEERRKQIESAPDGQVMIVAVLDGRLVGSADIVRGKGRRSHIGGIGMCVHDDFQQRGIGARLLAALIDTADNWLNLQRLELTVYVDNAPAIRLYKKFGFAVEGRRRATAFRDGVFVDDFMMARVRGLPAAGEAA
jgi:L-phenylalanine/L-methionine N-acetyltransferase